MKRTISILVTVLTIAFAASCMKEEAKEAFGGYSSSTSGELKNYMLDIADYLVTTNLDELETALAYDSNGKSTLTSMLYRTGGKSLKEEGAEWTVMRDNAVKGLRIKRLQENGQWELHFNGIYKMNGISYPTEYTMTVEDCGPEDSSHKSWKVALSGKRTEKGSYSCSFTSDGCLEYRVPNMTSKYWGAYGLILLQVYHKGVMIDTGAIELKGDRSGSIFTRLPL